MLNLSVYVCAHAGNKTQCDICSSKAMRKARLKKEQKDAVVGEISDVQDEPQQATPQQTTSTHHHNTHDEGISKQYP